MKTSLQVFIILLVLMFTSNAKSQGYFDEPTPFVTDNYDKQNAVLGAGTFGYLLVYEQKTDPESTAIVYSSYLSNDPPVTLIAEPGVHYRNPKLYYSSIGFFFDSIAMVFYEKVVGETTGLYYIKLADDGGQSAPYALATSGSVNNLFAYSYDDNYYLAYHSNGNLLAFHPIINNGMLTFSIPDTIFTGEITDLAINYNGIYWLAQNNDSTSLMMSRGSVGNPWSNPQILKTEQKINRIGGTTFAVNEGWVSFTYKAAEKWHINNYWHFSFNDPEFYSLELESDSAFDYDAFSAFVFVKGYDPQLYFCAFIHDTAGAREVFMNNTLLGGDEYAQLSFLGTECRNPRFYLGERAGSSSVWGYLIWEALVDGHWQIYRSRALFVWGGIREQQQPEGVSVSPNPARDFVRIQNNHELDLDIKIMDMSGRVILQTAAKDPEFTITTSQWPRGVYLLSASVGTKILTQKIVLE